MSYLRLSRFRKKYVVNENSKEIHRIGSDVYQCFINKLNNKTYITEDELKIYLKNGYDGCRWCLKEYDND